MEAILGRGLERREVVHHLNGERADNRIENLRVFGSQTEHMREHLALSHLVGPIKALRDKGFTFREVGQNLNIHRQTASRILKRCG